jgi:hypothetical protein
MGMVTPRSEFGHGAPNKRKASKWMLCLIEPGCFATEFCQDICEKKCRDLNYPRLSTPWRTILHFQCGHTWELHHDQQRDEWREKVNFDPETVALVDVAGSYL